MRLHPSLCGRRSRSQKTLDEEKSHVVSYLSDLLCRETELQRVMLALIVRIEFCFLSLGAF